LRRGEVLGLSWSAVDLDAGAVQVERALVRAGTDLVLGETKTAKSRRTRPLHPHLAAALRRWHVEQAAERLTAGPGWGDGWEADLVCTDPIGRPLTPDALRARIDRACDAAGICHFHPHALRHGFATLMLAAGATVHETADALGHTDATLVLSRYGHAIPERVVTGTLAVGDAIAAGRS
jgi:integrase